MHTTLYTVNETKCVIIRWYNFFLICLIYLKKIIVNKPDKKYIKKNKTQGTNIQIQQKEDRQNKTYPNIPNIASGL